MIDAFAISRAPRPTIPVLWARARAFFCGLVATRDDVRGLLRGGPLSPRERNTLMEWLKPAERLVRGLLIVDAVTDLLMSERGRRLRLNAVPLTPPQPPAPPPPPPRPEGTTRVLTIPYPGWHTIWRPPVIQPPAPPPRPRPAFDPDDPASWRAPFRVVHWRDAAHPAGTPSRPPARRPGAPSIAAHLRLVRRIEALRRVIDNPAAARRRLAAYLARLPRGLLGGFSKTVRHRGKRLAPCAEDLDALFDLSIPAIDAFNARLDSS